MQSFQPVRWFSYCGAYARKRIRCILNERDRYVSGMPKGADLYCRLFICTMKLQFQKQFDFAHDRTNKSGCWRCQSVTL